MKKRIVIIGGVAGGASTAARYRRLNEFAEIVILERGPYVSFANCGLPYYIGKVIQEREKLVLMTPEKFKQFFNIDVRVMNEVTSIDREKKTVKVLNREVGKEYELSYDKLVLAPGAEPIRPPFRGMDGIPIFSLRNIPDTEKIYDFIEKNNPVTATVIGAGYIGLEMVENLSRRGIRVKVIELLDQVLPTLDREMAQFVHNELVLNRVKLILGDGVAGFEKPTGGEGKYKVITQSGRKIETDLVILSIGIRPDTHLAKDCGLELTERGYIIVNEHMQTSDPDIYAVGDAVQVKNYITGKPTIVPLAGPANREGRIAADNLAGRKTTYKGSIGTAVLEVFDKTVAQTGLNEKQLKSLGITNYEKIYVHPQNHASYYPNAQEISMKLIFDTKDGRILGAQAVGGPGTEKRIDVIATVINFKGTVYDLENLELCYAPQFGCARDCVNMAGFVASNVMRGEVKIWHWNEAHRLKEEGATIIDVRGPELHAEGCIPGAINIPIGQLRERLDEIPKNQPVYLHCITGFTSYLAYRILKQHGFDPRNLTGGYKIYQIATLEEDSHIGELKPYFTPGC
ncbi:MAG: FAD-dependent oxidoreductase [Candidatus Heimdallarchaeum endolithica]|uniref:FAD-dependent oxidoreductase n=1 Tax=Candidatus Heimdallarchaeum endolithica TaxID=2876572 RepID=A0A9Y1BPS5_9ARCH|nr:MAG: FAD-dependent oxidoreductase [Candidatus Heimdallarchaeum endolithica]